MIVVCHAHARTNTRVSFGVYCVPACVIVTMYCYHYYYERLLSVLQLPLGLLLLLLL